METTEKVPIIYFNYPDENMISGKARVLFRAKQENDNSFIINEVLGSYDRQGNFFEGRNENGKLMFK